MAYIVEFIAHRMVYRHPIYLETFEKVIRLKKLVGDEIEEGPATVTKKHSKVP